MKFRLVLIAILLWSATAMATGNPTPSSVQGVVLDAATGEELSGVMVKVKGTTIYTHTDRYGRFELPVAPSENVELEFLLVSFEPLQTNAISVAETGEVSLIER